MLGSENAKREVLQRNSRRGSPQKSAESDTNLTSPSPLYGTHASPSMNGSNDSLPSAFIPREHSADLTLRKSSNKTLTISPLASPGSSAHAIQTASSSPTSLYSNYSYYGYDSLIPSPTSDRLQVPGTLSPTPNISRSRSSPSLGSASPSRGTFTPVSPKSPVSSLTSDDYLQLGIQHHEANRLAESAACFEKSARLSKDEKGTSGVGMLMWGLTLRHGWGCPKDEKQGFQWLRRAAEAAVGDLERAREGVDSTDVKGELVLAIYEVGQCFSHGWGVKKDPKMAVVCEIMYFRLQRYLFHYRAIFE
jgi:hypothetical protein